jgi:hypothetical protein
MRRKRAGEADQSLAYGNRRRRYRPRLELLEERVQLGDTILGMAAVALGADASFTWDAPFAGEPGASTLAWQHGLFARTETVRSPSTVSLSVDSPGGAANGLVRAERVIIAPPTQIVGGFSLPSSLDNETLAGQLALHRLTHAAALPSRAVLVNSGIAAAGGGASPSGGGLTPAAAPAASSNAAGHPALALSAATALSFHPSTGQLAIQTGTGEHTVREAPTPDGFIDVTIDGQAHSSNPRSASFDRALAGATGSTVTGIGLQRSGQDTLTVAAQPGAGGFTIQAAGATVITNNVATSGPLAIQAANITVNGALQGSSVSLAASGWVTVNAVGQIDAAKAATGGSMMVAAGVFVNSGQLHADGTSGGQITIQAGNILNAGPITADSTGPGENGGHIQIAFSGSYIATTAGVVSASSATGPGGQLILDGGSTSRLFTSGRQVATGSVGGIVQLLGRDLVLAGATVDASGLAGGGSVQIGGDSQEALAAASYTDTVTVTPASTVRADALRSGNGGQVSVWTGQSTAFAGMASARGGLAGGSGGLIELSGQGDLSYAGSADAGAPLGKSGRLLLDPKNLTISAAPAGVLPQFDLIDPDPTAGGGFGTEVSALSNGNVVVTHPNDGFGGISAGAVYLFDGLTGALISALVGGNPEDRVGAQAVEPDGFVLPTITLLSNGNYVVESQYWNGSRGAVTWGSAATGISGTVSDANSLIGSDPGDQVGVFGITALGNGNYVVDSPEWNSKSGAVTWGDGSTGISGIVSDTNSLVGSSSGDQVGLGGTLYEISHASVFSLGNGNYVVDSPAWNGNRGAVTWGNGSTGVSGTVSAENSLVGSEPGDDVGSNEFFNGVTKLSNGNYVVDSPYWNGNRGAATWANGHSGITGTISAANSLIGSNAGDEVGYTGPDVLGVTQLTNGNYLVSSWHWNDYRGAVTWGNGSTGISGTISAANSLVGATPANQYGEGGDEVGLNVLPLNNSNYVVESFSAVTWGNGSTGTSGTISDANSLIGGGSVTALSNGNYVVDNPGWNGNRGAVTWGDGNMETSGIVSDVNSLVGSNPGDLLGGSNPGDLVGSGGITPLSDGNYVVSSPQWNGNRGAVTWGNGSTGTSGTISAANSLVGNPADMVGGVIYREITGNFVLAGLVMALSDGNYLVTVQK